jgi:hypothetical protein
MPNAPIFPTPAALTPYSPSSFCGLAARRLFAGCAVGCVICEAAATALFTSTMYEDEEGGVIGGGEAEQEAEERICVDASWLKQGEFEGREGA